MGLSVFRSIVLLTSALILGVAPLRAYAFGDCSEQVKTGAPSTSCWFALSIKDRRASQLEISPYTLSLMIQIVDQIDAGLKRQLQDIERKVHKIDDSAPPGVGFVYDHEESPARSNTDCNVYLRKQRGSLDKSRPILSLGSPRCDNQAISLALTFWQALDRMTESVNASFEKYYFQTYPREDLAVKYKAAQYSNLWFGISTHRIATPRLPQSLGTFEDVLVPVTNYKVVKDDSLMNIASRVTGKEENWKALWALNPRDILDPTVVREGSVVKIPAKGIGWKEFLAHKVENRDIALRAYGDASYVGIVLTIRSQQRQSSPDAPLYLPLFDQSKIDGFAPVRTMVVK